MTIKCVLPNNYVDSPLVPGSLVGCRLGRAIPWEEELHGKSLSQAAGVHSGSRLASRGPEWFNTSESKPNPNPGQLYISVHRSRCSADQCKCGQPDDTLVRLRITAQCSAVQIIKSSASVQVPRVPPRASRLSYRPTGTRPCRRNHLDHLNRHAISITQAALIVQAPI